MSTRRYWFAMSGSATASPATAVKAVQGASGAKVHVAVDDATPLAYVEVLSDEQKATTVGFLTRALGWFSEQGINCRRILSETARPAGQRTGTRAAVPSISRRSAPSRPRP